LRQQQPYKKQIKTIYENKFKIKQILKGGITKKMMKMKGKKGEEYKKGKKKKKKVNPCKHWMRGVDTHTFLNVFGKIFQTSPSAPLSLLFL